MKSSNDRREIAISKFNYSLGFKSHVCDTYWYYLLGEAW